MVQRFGNKMFYDHLQRIGMQNTQTDLVHKYTHPGVKKYKKQLIATVMGKKPKSSSANAAAPPKTAAASSRSSKP